MIIQHSISLTLSEENLSDSDSDRVEIYTKQNCDVSKMKAIASKRESVKKKKMKQTWTKMAFDSSS